eukprot:64641-Chlamydomonas_euryale.AAC.5
MSAAALRTHAGSGRAAGACQYIVPVAAVHLTKRQGTIVCRKTVNCRSPAGNESCTPGTSSSA